MDEFGPSAPPLLGGAATGIASLALYATGEVYHNGICIARTSFQRDLPPIFAALADARLQTRMAMAVEQATAAGVTMRASLDESTSHGAVLTTSPFTTTARITQWQLYVQQISPLPSVG